MLEMLWFRDGRHLFSLGKKPFKFHIFQVSNISQPFVTCSEFSEACFFISNGLTLSLSEKNKPLLLFVQNFASKIISMSKVA